MAAVAIGIIDVGLPGSVFAFSCVKVSKWKLEARLKPHL